MTLRGVMTPSTVGVMTPTPRKGIRRIRSSHLADHLDRVMVRVESTIRADRSDLAWEEVAGLVKDEVNRTTKPIRELLKALEAEAIEARMVNIQTGRGGPRAAGLEEMAERLKVALKGGRES